METLELFKKLDEISQVTLGKDRNQLSAAESSAKKRKVEFLISQIAYNCKEAFKQQNQHSEGVQQSQHEAQKCETVLEQAVRHKKFLQFKLTRLKQESKKMQHELEEKISSLFPDLVFDVENMTDESQQILEKSVVEEKEHRFKLNGENQDIARNIHKAKQEKQNIERKLSAFQNTVSEFQNQLVRLKDKLKRNDIQLNPDIRDVLGLPPKLHVLYHKLSALAARRKEYSIAIKKSGLNVKLANKFQVQISVYANEKLSIFFAQNIRVSKNLLNELVQGDSSFYWLDVVAGKSDIDVPSPNLRTRLKKISVEGILKELEHRFDKMKELEAEFQVLRNNTQLKKNFLQVIGYKIDQVDVTIVQSLPQGVVVPEKATSVSSGEILQKEDLVNQLKCSWLAAWKIEVQLERSVLAELYSVEGWTSRQNNSLTFYLCLNSKLNLEVVFQNQNQRKFLRSLAASINATEYSSAKELLQKTFASLVEYKM
eukprot:maker-scaffold_7-snap-gene-8.62-mRNA-1 protein AED:0.31 eAED:0.31 QI:34/1/1/1/0.33/0.14/7/18/483